MGRVPPGAEADRGAALSDGRRQRKDENAMFLRMSVEEDPFTEAWAGHLSGPGTMAGRGPRLSLPGRADTAAARRRTMGKGA